MKTVVCAIGVLAIGIASSALSLPQHERSELEEVVVTGSFVTQGGAKDVNFLRGEVHQLRLPHPDTFTAEGLISEHSIALDTKRACPQVFCLVGESIEASLIAQPDARYLVGLGFATNVESEGWDRRPVNLIAVVDKSGSMNGAPLALVRESLREVLSQLRPGDQLSVVLYGDRAHVHLPPTRIELANRQQIRSAIDAIASAGSTAMEAGLALGFEVARTTRHEFDGTTRVMLFTDERPNVGNTHASGFMSMAKTASLEGIGLTTIGVGVQFDAALATTIGSVRGGNLFFMRDGADVRHVFRDELPYMISELAHDLEVTIEPQSGYAIAGIYGVPDQLLGWQNERSVRVTLPTVFLSSKAGGLFVALAKSRDDAHLPARPVGNRPLLTASVSYTPVNVQHRENDGIEVFVPSEKPSDAIALAHTLIDEFTVLHRALTAVHIENNHELAYQHLRAFADRLRDFDDARLAKERELVFSLEEQLAFLSGHASEGQRVRTPLVKLWGSWEVSSIQGQSSLRRRERLHFSPDGTYKHYERENGRHVVVDDADYGANRRQIVLEGSGLVFDYEVRGNELVLADRSHNNLIFLRRKQALSEER